MALPHFALLPARAGPEARSMNSRLVMAATAAAPVVGPQAGGASRLCMGMQPRGALPTLMCPILRQ